MPSAFGKPVTTANRFGVAATPSSWTLITTLTASASSSLSYTSFSSASYKTYALLFAGWRPSDNNVQVTVYFSLDNGATYPTALTTYHMLICDGTTTAASISGANVDFGQVFYRLYPDVQASMNGILYFSYGPGTAARSNLTGTLSGLAQHTSRTSPTVSGCYYNSATEVNAMKFQMSAGTITNGNIKIYGIT